MLAGREVAWPGPIPQAEQAQGEVLSPELARVIGLLESAKKESPGQWIAKCPTHDDSTASLAVTQGEDGRVLLYCGAGCDTKDVLGALGLKFSDLSPQKERKPVSSHRTATYRYVDERGEVVRLADRYAVRYDDGTTGKTFRQRGPNGERSVKGLRNVPYNLPDVLYQANQGGRVFVVEGEKDADNLRAIGLVATCNVMGAGKWRDELSPHFGGAEVVILPDNDTAGRSHAKKVSKSVGPHARSVRIVNLPGLKPKGDVSDWLESGGSRERLEALCVAEQPRPVTPEVTTIQVGFDELAMREQADEALLGSRFEVYQRAGQLVRVTRADQLQVEHLPEPSLRELLSSCVIWRKETEEGPKRVSVPQPVVKAMLAACDLKQPRLVEVSNAPALLPDGSLVDREGYHPDSGFLLHLGGRSYSPIPSTPTEQDARDAMSMLESLFEDFPFEDQSDKAAALSLALTLAARHAIPAAKPLFLIDAPQMSTGKTCLVHTATAIATGHLAGTKTFPVGRGADEEQQKLLITVGLSGDAVVLFDDVKADIKGTVIDAALTAPDGFYEGRILGGNRQARVRLPTMVATGNNATVAGDTSRRVCPCRIATGESNPELRTFRHDLPRDAVANHADLLPAALTAVRWRLQSKLKGLQPISSFGRWSYVVRDTLHLLGYGDCWGGNQRLRDFGDPESEAKAELIDAWESRFGSAFQNGLTVKELCRHASHKGEGSDDGRLAEALAALNPRLRPDRLAEQTHLVGQVLKKLNGAVINGRSLSHVGFAKGTVKRWALISQ